MAHLFFLAELDFGVLKSYLAAALSLVTLFGIPCLIYLTITKIKREQSAIKSFTNSELFESLKEVSDEKIALHNDLKKYFSMLYIQAKQNPQDRINILVELKDKINAYDKDIERDIDSLVKKTKIHSADLIAIVYIVRIGKLNLTEIAQKLEELIELEKIQLAFYE